jgi:hypothetical protein
MMKLQLLMSWQKFCQGFPLFLETENFCSRTHMLHMIDNLQMSTAHINAADKSSCVYLLHSHMQQAVVLNVSAVLMAAADSMFREHLLHTHMQQAL